MGLDLVVVGGLPGGDEWYGNIVAELLRMLMRVLAVVTLID